jgi:hypothetical protein
MGKFGTRTNGDREREGSRVQKGSNAPDGAGSNKVQSRLTALVQRFKGSIEKS